MHLYYNLSQQSNNRMDIVNVYLCVIITFWIPQDMTQNHNLYFYRIIRHTIYIRTYGRYVKNWIILIFNQVGILLVIFLINLIGMPSLTNLSMSIIITQLFPVSMKNNTLKSCLPIHRYTTVIQIKIFIMFIYLMFHHAVNINFK